MNSKGGNKLSETAVDALCIAGKIAKEGLICATKVAIVTSIVTYKITKIAAHRSAPYIKRGLKQGAELSKHMYKIAKSEVREKAPEVLEVISTFSKKIHTVVNRHIDMLPDRRIATIGVPGVLGTILIATATISLNTRDKMLAHLDRVTLSDVADERGVVTQAVLFYDSDSDARKTYNDFLSRFQIRAHHWDITPIGDGVIRIKTKEQAGTPMEFYINHYDSGEDGIRSMFEYFKEHDIQPTGYQLRAHNYDRNLERFLEILPDHEVSFLMVGSCRGEQILSNLRDKHPESQILYTKGTGDFVISNDIVTLFAEQMRQNRAITWSSIREQEKRYATSRGQSARFSEYVFPGMQDDPESLER